MIHPVSFSLERTDGSSLFVGESDATKHTEPILALFRETTYEEVKDQIVWGKGIFFDDTGVSIQEGLGKGSDSLYGMIFSEEERREIKRIEGETDRRVIEMRQWMADVITNPELLLYCAFLDRTSAQSIVPRNVFEQSIPSAGADIVDRVERIMNIGMDPAFVPVVFAAERRSLGLTKAVEEAFLDNPDLCVQFVDIISRLDYRQPETKQRIDALISRIIPALPVGTPKEERRAVGSKMRTLFKSTSKDRVPTDRMAERLLSVTAANYIFVHKALDIDNIRGLMQKRNEVDFLERGWRALTPYARNLERARYLVAVKKHTKQLFSRLFPQMADAVCVGKLAWFDLVKYAGMPGQYHRGEPNGYFDPTNNVVGIISPDQVYGIGMNLLNIVSKTTFKTEARKYVADMITMVHEFGHSVVKSLVYREIPRPRNAKDTAFSALDEGVAVLLELLSIKRLLENPAAYWLDTMDIQSLTKYHYTRLDRLKREKSEYTEGTFRLVYRLYAKAAYGKNTQEDMGRGLAAVRAFLESVDPQKAMSTLRASDEYQALLARGDSEEMKRFFVAENRSF